MEATIMESLDLVPLITFVAVTLYTPGPNNVTSASMGLVFGYFKTLPFHAGILIGFTTVMLSCGIMSGLILRILPSLSHWLRWIGCFYILWLAYKTLKASYAFDDGREVKRLGFFYGVFLQLVNVKGLVFGITLFSTFLQPIASNPFLLVISTLMLTTMVFTSLTLWTLSGTALKRWIANPAVKKYINIFLSMLLVYTALSLLNMGS